MKTSTFISLLIVINLVVPCTASDDHDNFKERIESLENQVRLLTTSVRRLLPTPLTPEQEERRATIRQFVIEQIIFPFFFVTIIVGAKIWSLQGEVNPQPQP